MNGAHARWTASMYSRGRLAATRRPTYAALHEKKPVGDKQQKKIRGETHSGKRPREDLSLCILQSLFHDMVGLLPAIVRVAARIRLLLVHQKRYGIRVGGDAGMLAEKMMRVGDSLIVQLVCDSLVTFLKITNDRTMTKFETNVRIKEISPYTRHLNIRGGDRIRWAPNDKSTSAPVCMRKPDMSGQPYMTIKTVLDCTDEHIIANTTTTSR